MRIVDTKEMKEIEQALSKRISILNERLIIENVGVKGAEIFKISS